MDPPCTILNQEVGEVAGDRNYSRVNAADSRPKLKGGGGNLHSAGKLTRVKRIQWEERCIKAILKRERQGADTEAAQKTEGPPLPLAHGL